MKEEIFKVSYERFECAKYHTSSPIKYPHPLNTTTNKVDEDSWGDFIDEEIEFSRRRKKKYVYIHNNTSNSESDYVENYGNRLADVRKTNCMIVVEKEGDKVSIKLFHGFKNRKVGNSWFKISRNVDYITVNVKTGDVYYGYLYDYQKKRKAKKSIRRNVFISSPISTLKSKIKNAISGYVNNQYDVISEAVSKFMFEIDGREDFETLDFEKRLFKFYLTKKNIKYPNNFHLYSSVLFGPSIRKHLKKSENKLIDAFMKENGFHGKKLKSALHTCVSLNYQLYLDAKNLFGEDWINQDDGFILNALNSRNNLSYRRIPAEFRNVISTEELKRVFRLFKRVYFDGVLDNYTFLDHIRMYTELKMFGESDLRWMSDEDSKESFRQEHLDWTDKLQFYKRGNYTRTYPPYMFEVIEQPINGYYPVILNNSSEYNEESSVQSNCVKTYIGWASSLIVSLRKGSPNSDERATIEYRISKPGDKIECHRVQSLGRFNSKLGPEWVDTLFRLDEYLLSCIKDKRFETVKLTKKCANGEILNSDSEWTDNGILKWSYKGIENDSTTIFEWL